MSSLDIEPLKLFNERARKLEESAFYQWLLNAKRPLTPEERACDDWVNREGVASESLEAFCLSLRLFVQNSDGFSLKCLSEIYAKLPPEAAEGTKLFNEARDGLLKFLEQRSMIQLDAGNTTNTDFFEMVMYGGIVHDKKKHREQFKRWTKHPGISGLAFWYFTGIVLQYMKTILPIAAMNKVLIERL